MSACLAQLAPKNSRVFAVDHIQEVNDYAKFNI